MIKYYRLASINNNFNMLLNIGDKVCVIFTLNPFIFRRAQMIDKINYECKLFYKDYENKELVHVEDIL